MTALRVARQLDRLELAKCCGISLADIQALEQGRLGRFSDPDYLAGLLLRLCQVFEVDPTILTNRIFRLMADPGKSVSKPDTMPTAPVLQSRYFFAGIFALALIIPFAGLWWFVTA